MCQVAYGHIAVTVRTQSHIDAPSAGNYSVFVAVDCLLIPSAFTAIQKVEVAYQALPDCTRAACAYPGHIRGAA
jgi:hypothetical protein